MNEIDFLLSIDSKKIKYGLSRTYKFLEICGNPEQSFNSIQVVGTNGKGSTSAMLAKILIDNQLDTGLFTSPHLVRINERITVNSNQISNDFIIYFIKKYKKDIISLEVSFFEIITVMAAYYFQIKDIDIAVLETGLGGRLDSVTALQSAMIIYTIINKDHSQILGNSIEKITEEKSGAIQTHTQKIISVNQQNSVKNILNYRAKINECRIRYIENYDYRFDSLALHGMHQQENAALAIHAIKDIQDLFFIKCNNIDKSLSSVYWPGRMQYIKNNPDVIFDVAHNEHGIEAFINYFKLIKKKYSKSYILIGFEDSKEIDIGLKKICTYFDNISLTETNIRSCMAISKLNDKCSLYSNHINSIKNPLKAIKFNLQQLTSSDVFVILGSHYFGPHINNIFKNCFDYNMKN